MSEPTRCCGTAISYDFCHWCEELTAQFSRDHCDCTEIICDGCGRIVDRMWKEYDDDPQQPQGEELRR